MNTDDIIVTIAGFGFVYAVYKLYLRIGYGIGTYRGLYGKNRGIPKWLRKDDDKE